MASIFVVDDDRITSKLLVTLLELEGHQVRANSHPSQVLELSRGAAPDAFVIDCHLIDSDGVLLLKAIRAEPSLARVPVIMTSGLDRHDECFHAGAQSFLHKPFRPDELIAALNNALSASASAGPANTRR